MLLFSKTFTCVQNQEVCVNGDNNTNSFSAKEFVSMSPLTVGSWFRKHANVFGIINIVFKIAKIIFINDSIAFNIKSMLSVSITMFLI